MSTFLDNAGLSAHAHPAQVRSNKCQELLVAPTPTDTMSSTSYINVLVSFKMSRGSGPSEYPPIVPTTVRIQRIVSPQTANFYFDLIYML